jgi:hypothetical protein
MPLANFCNRRSTRAPVPSPDCRARGSPEGAPRRPRRPRLGRRDPRCASPPRGDLAPADPRLTAWCQLRSFSCTLTVPRAAFLSEDIASERRPCRGGELATSHRCRVRRRCTSDLWRLLSRTLCGRPSVQSPVRARRGSPPPPPRQRQRLTTTRDAFHRQVFPGPPACAEGTTQGFGWEPVTVLLAWPRGAGFRGPFANLCSREGWLGFAASARSSRVGARLCPVDFDDAGSRLTTSAIETIHEHDPECPSSAAPHPQSPAGAAFLPEVAPSRARSGLRMAGLACASWPAEVPRVRGCAVGDGDAGPFATSPTAIARGRSLAPTRSTRAPPVANRDERRPETTASPETRCARLPRSTSLASARAPPCVPGPAAAGASGKGPRRVPTREGQRTQPHPRCLPSPGDAPRSGSRPTLHRLSPVCGKGVASASSIPDSTPSS